MKAWKRPEHLWVGINGKPSGYHALKEAILIARWLHAGVTAIAVTPLYEGDLSLTGVGSVHKNLYADIEKSLRRSLEIAESLQYPIKIKAAGGDVCDQLFEAAYASSRPGWIVIGASPSFSGLRWAAGTPLFSLFTRSSLPVLIVPEKTALSGETVWLDLAGIQRDGESAGFFLETWIDRSVHVASWFGVDRLVIARPVDFADQHLLQNILSKRQEKRSHPDAFRGDTLLFIEVVDFPYRSIHEVFSSMERSSASLLLIPSPRSRTLYIRESHPSLPVRMKSILGQVFEQTAQSNGLFRFSGKWRFSPVAWHNEKRLRALPCPVLLLCESPRGR